MGKLMVFGIIILILGGLVTVGLGLVLPTIIDQMIEDGLEDALIIEKDDVDESWSFDANLNAISPYGDEWLYNGPENTEAAPTYESFHIFNITNYNPLNNSFSGGKPIYEEVGPLVTRKIDNRVVDDYDNEGIITFRQASWYLIDETQSTIALDDIVYTWNPVYRTYAQIGRFNTLLETLLVNAGVNLPKSETELFFGLGQTLLNGSIYQMAEGFMLSNLTLPLSTALQMAQQQWGNLTIVPTGLDAYEAAAFVATYLSGTLDMNATQVNSFLNNANRNYAVGINATALGVFNATYTDPTYSALWQGLYGLTATQVAYLGAFVNNFLLAQVVPGYMALNGFSLVAKRTVNQVLFSYDDPVLEANTALFDNNTAWDGGKKINSGSKDLDEIWNEYSDDGLAKWATGWKEDVAGTDATHWAPDVGKDDTLLAWNSDTRRQLDFVYLKESEVEGIKTLRFHLDPNELNIDSNYHQYIRGLGNMTPTMYDDSTGLKIMLGTPIYVGQPRFQIWSATQNTAPEELDIILDVEPNTGLVLWGHKRLQVNIKLYNFSFFNTDVKGAYPLEAQDGTSHYIEPIVWIDRFAMIPADKVEEATDDIDALISGKELAGLASIAGLGFGLVLFAAGAAMVIVPKFASGDAPE